MLRGEFAEILPAIELREDSNEILAALQTIVRDNNLVQMLIRIASPVSTSDTPDREHLQVLTDIPRDNPEFRNVCAAVCANPELLRICNQYDENPKLVTQLVQALAQPAMRDILMRISRLPPQTLTLIRDMLGLDDDSTRALEAAPRRREIFNLLYFGANRPATLAAMQIAMRNSRVPALGLAVIEGKGLAGWIARKAGRFL